MAEQETQKALKMVDIVDFSMQDKPIKVTDAFNSLIADKVTNSIDARKQEVSAKMFADKVEEPSVEEPSTETPSVDNSVEEPPAESTEIQT
jgi:hypothetical protein